MNFLNVNTNRRLVKNKDIDKNIKNTTENQL